MNEAPRGERTGRLASEHHEDARASSASDHVARTSSSSEFDEARARVSEDGVRPDFRPEPGEYDPGPGPYVDLYQGRSGQLSPNARPDGTEVTTRLRSRGPAPQLVAWVPSVRVQQGRDAVIRAALLDGEGHPVPADSVAVRVTPAREPEHAVDAVMNPAPASDGGQYEYRWATAQVPRPTGNEPPFAVEYVVRAEGTFRGERFERVVAGAFHVHAAGGALDPATAHFAREDGDLRLSARVNIQRAGNYWAYAELWGGEGGTRPIAMARDRFENLAPGEHTITLTFGGLIIRDSNIDGPYTVRNIRFVQADSVPPQEQDPIAQLPPTPAWRASEFY